MHYFTKTGEKPKKRRKTKNKAMIFDILDSAHEAGQDVAPKELQDLNNLLLGQSKNIPSNDSTKIFTVHSKLIYFT